MGDLRAVLGARMTVLHVIVLSSYVHDRLLLLWTYGPRCEPLALLLLTCVLLIAELRIQLFLASMST